MFIHKLFKDKNYRFTKLAKPKNRKVPYQRKLSQQQIDDIQTHMESEEVTFPLPDTKYAGKCFFKTSIGRAHKMYNVLPSCTRKLSLSTYYKYRPKKFKVQGKIPFHQSCCKHCQNFEAVIDEMSKFMSGIPRNLADCIDSSMCKYDTYFPPMPCILRTCQNCGIQRLSTKLIQQNKAKLQDKCKRFFVKQWTTKNEMKNGERSSYLAWDHLRLSFKGILDLYLKLLADMSEHTFFASWNYVQYKKCKNLIESGEVVMVQDFAQNFLCELQNEPSAIHWLHKQTTLHPTIVYYRCPHNNYCLVTHEVVHVSNDLKHDAHLVDKFHTTTMDVLKQHNVLVRKIFKFSDQAPSQYKNKTSFDYLSKVELPTMHCFYGVQHGKGPCDACTGRVKQSIK